MGGRRRSARQEERENDGKSILMKTNGQQQLNVSPWQCCRGNVPFLYRAEGQRINPRLHEGGIVQRFLEDLLPWIGLECSWISQWAVPLTTSHTMIFPEASPEASRRQ